ncbi:hypothetical protein EOA75_01445 [Mesorhizobium sp. M1A.F.Ca.IN.022.07.1.1]|uniref:hypothetical protein n=1 Tax=unclassified Mesorhizobium TaxID=325217 RepID=UPI000FCA9294|nr:MULTISPECIES: hypothetical protein [unclassified Mesorhizobium]RUV98226.1 hypothetical protein EOA75_01445 [Mesorhizobium sp. M1A.F.Ca.IN.022.07.1.1]RWI97878.1 MAG: hypothetical protein EOR22_05965 [Mesorhizobium sp.]TIQ07834.1 MAG: hypothetical protein E5X50_16080 [Mesorhizobium sp.]TIR22134.1 MAG: hypothetical protein E5X33_09380 [Mesorhizobium sp.]
MSGQGYFGQQTTSDDTAEINRLRFLIRQELAQARTGIPVKVVAVHGGGVGAPPTVDVMPLINQTDGQGNQTPHGVIYGIATMRNQGGTNGIINDPKVGDIGHMTISDRDISALKANGGAQSNPGSFRRGNMSDGIYQGAIANPANQDQAVQFTEGGIKLFDKNGQIIDFAAGSITITTAQLRVTGDVIAGAGGENISVLNHLHTNVQPGGGTSGPPEPGT